jgi:L-threonylcarbamoyladenylate synthase
MHSIDSISNETNVSLQSQQQPLSHDAESHSTIYPPSSSSSAPTHTARMVRLPRDLAASVERLRQGQLVAFPTETVYGLGAHALDTEACRRIFAAKERPLTDPLIVHVLTHEDASRLWRATSESTSTDTESTDTTTAAEATVLYLLTKRFWPGPLTLVARAADHVPAILMAGTGFVACRSPAHAIARALLEASHLPLAAPSANKFGHVSPTQARHVYEDLQYEDVWIVQNRMHASEEDDVSNSDEEEEDEPLSVGVESTVVQCTHVTLNDDIPTVHLKILRPGAISAEDLHECLHPHGWQAVIQTPQQRVPEDNAQGQVAPGQLIRHYSPRTPSYLIAEALAQSSVPDHDATSARLLSKAVLIDFGQRLPHWQHACLAYRDLSASHNADQAAQVVFDTLRWAEQVPHAQCILFPQLTSSNDNASTSSNSALYLAIQDRLTRAASGVVLHEWDDLVKECKEE